MIRQKSNIIIEKTIQSETKNSNEKNSNYEFNENNVVNYVALVEKKRTRKKIKKLKKKYQILLKNNKRLQTFIRKDEIQTSIKYKYNVASTNNDSLNESF